MFGTFFVFDLIMKEDLMKTNTTNKDRKKKTETQSPGEAKLKGFLDMTAPSAVQFYTDHYICGNTYRSVWALREYPTATDEQAILRHLGEKDGVTLRIYTRQVTPAEEKKIISNAANKNRMKQGITENLQETVTAASNLQDVTNIIAAIQRYSKDTGDYPPAAACGGGGRGEQWYPCTYQRSPAQCKNAAQPYEHHVQQGGPDL